MQSAKGHGGCSPRAFHCNTNTRDRYGKLTAYGNDVDFFACFIIPLDL